MRYARLVLVGNGATVLKNETLGKQIDEFDLVVRFNNFVLNEENEKYVGKKTSFIGRRSCGDVKWWKPNEFDMIFNFVTYCTVTQGMQLVANQVKSVYGASCHEVGVEECKQIGEDIGLDQPHNERASVGILAIGHFIKMSPKIWICGFDNVIKPNYRADLEHYFPKKPVDAKFHNWQKETAYIKGLMTKGQIEVLGV